MGLHPCVPFERARARAAPRRHRHRGARPRVRMRPARRPPRTPLPCARLAVLDRLALLADDLRFFHRHLDYEASPGCAQLHKARSLAARRPPSPARRLPPSAIRRLPPAAYPPQVTSLLPACRVRAAPSPHLVSSCPRPCRALGDMPPRGSRRSRARRCSCTDTGATRSAAPRRAACCCGSRRAG